VRVGATDDRNCVTYAPKPRANTATYVDALKQIVVAEVVIGNALVGFGVRQHA